MFPEAGSGTRSLMDNCIILFWGITDFQKIKNTYCPTSIQKYIHKSMRKETALGLAVHLDDLNLSSAPF